MIHRGFIAFFILAARLLVLVTTATTSVYAQQPPSVLVHYPETIFMNAKIVTLDNHQMDPDPGSIIYPQCFCPGQP